MTPTFIYKAIKGQALPLENEGMATRDFIYVDDLCDGIYKSLITEFDSNFSLFQLGAGYETSINNLIDNLKRILNKKIEVINADKRSGEIYRNYLDITIARENFGFSPCITLSKGLKKTINWFISNMRKEKS